MNKNELLRQLRLYSERCRQLTVQNEDYARKIATLQNAVAERNTVIEQLLAKKADSKPTPVLEETAQEENTVTGGDIPLTNTDNSSAPAAPATLDAAGEYAADCISKIVIESASACNKIASSESANKKDLLNLIIGKTENAKFEITDILCSECTDEQKRAMIDGCAKDTFDYFTSVLAQM